jgi:hypothetical protein
LIRCEDFIKNRNHPSFRIVELDWKSGEISLGDGGIPETTTDDYCEVSIDQDVSSYNNDDDIYFLLYERERNVTEGGQVTCLYIKLSAKERKIQQIGSTFMLPSDDFNFVNLCHGVVRGLSASIDKINQFDLYTRQTLPPILLAQKLTPSYENLRLSSYAWTEDRIYLARADGKDECDYNKEPLVITNRKSFIDVCCMKTGSVTTLPRIFDGNIINLSIWPDGRYLYVNTKKRHHWVKVLRGKCYTG